MQYIISVENSVTRHPLYRLNEPINLKIAVGEHVAIVGDNGAGKSLLVDTLIGRYPLLLNEVAYDFRPQHPDWSAITSSILPSAILTAIRTATIITSSGGTHRTWKRLLSYATCYLPVRTRL